MTIHEAGDQFWDGHGGPKTVFEEAWLDGVQQIPREAARSPWRPVGWGAAFGRLTGCRGGVPSWRTAWGLARREAECPGCAARKHRRDGEALLEY